MHGPRLATLAIQRLLRAQRCGFCNHILLRDNWEYPQNQLQKYADSSVRRSKALTRKKLRADTPQWSNKHVKTKSEGLLSQSTDVKQVVTTPAVTAANMPVFSTTLALFGSYSSTAMNILLCKSVKYLNNMFQKHKGQMKCRDKAFASAQWHPYLRCLSKNDNNRSHAFDWIACSSAESIPIKILLEISSTYNNLRPS